MGGAESMNAVSKQRKWYVHKKKQAVQKDSLNTAMSRSVRSRIEDFEALSRGSGGEARDSSKDRRNEVVTEKRKTRVCARRWCYARVMPCIYETYVTSRISMVMRRRRSMAWTSLRDGFCISSIQCWVRTKQKAQKSLHGVTFICA